MQPFETSQSNLHSEEDQQQNEFSPDVRKEGLFVKKPVLRMQKSFDSYRSKINNMLENSRLSSAIKYGNLKKRSINKSLIGLPTNFRVVQHIGINEKSKSYEVTYTLFFYFIFVQ